MSAAYLRDAGVCKKDKRRAVIEVTVRYTLLCFARVEGESLLDKELRQVRRLQLKKIKSQTLV
jgi:hypothetical protein